MVASRNSSLLAVQLCIHRCEYVKQAFTQQPVCTLCALQVLSDFAKRPTDKLMRCCRVKHAFTKVSYNRISPNFVAVS